jgi:hypothetical protein
MIRLKRTAAGQAVYDFTNAWWVNVFTVDERFGDMENETFYTSADVFAAQEQFEQLMRVANKHILRDMSGMVDVFNDTLDTGERVVEDVKIELDDDACHWTLTTSRELTDDEIEKLKDEISGQNSDGLGEGLESEDVEMDSYSEQVENDDGEFDECTYTEYAHIELWRGDMDNVVECTKIG